MNTKEFIEKQKELYKTFKPCYCKAIGAIVHFNSDGLHHLLYNKRRPRDVKQKHRRAKLISYIVKAIENGQKVEVRNYKNPLSQIWSLEYEVESKKIKVILIRTSSNKIYFLSIMEKRRRKNPSY